MSNLKRVSLYIMYITDLAALLLAFFVAYPIRKLLPFREGYSLPQMSIYTPLLMGTVVAYVIVAFLLLYNENFSGRSVTEEIRASARMVAVVMALDVLIFYFAKTSENYSRIFVAVFIILSFLFDVIFRLLVKKGIIPLYKKGRGSERIILATEENRVEEILERLNDEADWRFQVIGLILVDCEKKGEQICGLPVISNRSEALTDLFEQQVDSVLLALPPQVPEKDWVEVLQSIGKTVYIHLDEFYYSDAKRMLDYLGDCAVVSYQPAMPVRGRSLVIKRGLDVLASLLLLPIVLIVLLLVSILNGFGAGRPVIIGRERVGKNGRRFHMYHFRTLRNDALERAQKEKRPYTVLGRFLRTTHLDGLPMVLNVLVGDMSFVGPQAVTVERIKEGNLKHIRNLCTRPGIVGVWSTRRSDGKRADLNEYISTWSLRLDGKLLAKSVLQFLFGVTVRAEESSWQTEENLEIVLYREKNLPIVYDKSIVDEVHNLMPIWYTLSKRVFDISLSLAGIVLLSWLFIILSFYIISDDGGNPIYKHRRVGKFGKPIMVLKFRTMKKEEGNLEKILAPEQLIQYHTEFKIDDDPRKTKFGDFLRRSSLDELPQLFNILGGSMSFVGPRPVTEDEVQLYGDDIAKFLSVKPGLTGYWQAYARNNATYESGDRQKMEMYYIDNQSFRFDVKIMFKTIGSVLKQEGAQ